MDDLHREAVLEDKARDLRAEYEAFRLSLDGGWSGDSVDDGVPEVMTAEVNTPLMALDALEEAVRRQEQKEET